MVTDEKARLRGWARARRGGPPDAGERLRDRALPLVPAGEAVAGFWPMPGEIDLRPLLHALHARGDRVLLPETTRRGEALVFRRWEPGVRMLDGRFGTVHPEGAVGSPALLLVPLLLFDRGGNRLGYGGGYYDRTLAALPGVRAFGCAFANQEVDAVPVLPHDVPLHAVLTEEGALFRPEPPCGSCSSGTSSAARAGTPLLPPFPG